MKTDQRAKPVTVIKSGIIQYFKTREDASMFLFNKICKVSLDNLMRNPTETESAFYTFTIDFKEFESKTQSLMFCR